MPQTTAVSPTRITALPLLCDREPVLTTGCLNSSGVRPLGRVGEDRDDAGLRWARRNGPGESFAKVSREKDSAEGAADVLAIVDV